MIKRVKVGSFVGKNEGTSRREYLARLVNFLDARITKCRSGSVLLLVHVVCVLWSGHTVECL